MSLSDKFTELGSKLVILSNRIKYLASQPRLNASQSDNTEKLEGKSKTQVNAVLASKTIAHASQITNPHDVTAEQIGIPTKAQVDAQISTLIPSGILPFSNLGTQDYLPLGVAGSFEGASTNPTDQTVGMIIEQDGTLVVLRNGTNGSTMGVYYGYLTNAELGPFDTPTRTNKIYRPSYFPSNVKAKALVHASEFILIGRLVTVDTAEDAGWFVSITNGTFDDRLHTGCVLSTADGQAIFGEISTRSASLVIDDLIYFVIPYDGGQRGFYGLTLYTCHIDEINSGTIQGIQQIEGITTEGIHSTQVDKAQIMLAPVVASHDPADNPVVLLSGTFRSMNLLHSGQYAAYACASDDGRIRIALSHLGYCASSYTSASYHSMTSCVFDPATKLAVADPIPGPRATITMSTDQRRITVAGGLFNYTARINLGLTNPQNSSSVNALITRNGTIFSYTVGSHIDTVTFGRQRHYDYTTRFDTIRRVETDRRSVGYVSRSDNAQFPTAIGSLLGGAVYLGDNKMMIYADGRDEQGVIRSGLVLTKLEGGHRDHAYYSAFNNNAARYGYAPNSTRTHITDPSIGVRNEKEWHYPICEVIGQETHLSGWVFSGSTSTPGTRKQFLHSDFTQSGDTLTVSDNVLIQAARDIAATQIDVVGPSTKAYGILIIPQKSGVPPFMWAHTLDSATRRSYLIFAQIDELLISNGVLTGVVLGEVHTPLLTGTDTTDISWNSNSYPGSRGAWCFYDTDDAVLIGGYVPLTRSYIGSSARFLSKLKWSKSQNRFILHKNATRVSNMLPSHDFAFFAHPEHGFCQANGDYHGAITSDYLTKCLMMPIAKTEAEFDAYVRPPESEAIILTSQDVAEGWSVYFTDQTPLFMIGNSYTLQPTDFDLRDIDPNPQSKTFFVYVTLVNDQPQYLIQNTELEETFTTMFIGTVATGLTQIESINIDKVYRIDTVRISTTPVGSAIPTSTGHPADTERLSWT